MIELDYALSQVRRLSGMQGWPFFEEGQAELARVLAELSEDREQAENLITEITNHSVRCPQPNELRAQLKRQVAETLTECRFKLCDGSGWVIKEKDGMSAAAPCQCRFTVTK